MCSKLCRAVSLDLTHKTTEQDVPEPGDIHYMS